MEQNMKIDMLLCSLAFQEYNIRQNILSLIVKKQDISNENQKNNIQLEIDMLRSKANYLYEMRNEQTKNVDNCNKR